MDGAFPWDRIEETAMRYQICQSKRHEGGEAEDRMIQAAAFLLLFESHTETDLRSNTCRQHVFKAQCYARSIERGAPGFEEIGERWGLGQRPNTESRRQHQK